MTNSVSKYFAKLLKGTDEEASCQSADPALLKSADIAFILVGVESNHPSQSASSVAAVVDVAMDADWMVQDILGNLVVLVSGLDHMRDHHPQEQSVLVKNVLQSVDGSARVIFGERRALYGNLGSSKRLSYGVQFLDATQIIAALDRVLVGHAEEYLSA